MSLSARRVLSFAIVALLCVGSARLEAVSVRDIIELSRAGLSDEILLALIETDKTIFTLSNEQLIDLKKNGVGDRVIIAMLEQGRKPPKVESPAPPAAPIETVNPDPQPEPALRPPPERRRPSRPLDPYTSSYNPYVSPVAPYSPPPSTTVVVVPTPVYYPYPIAVPQRTRPQHCEPGRIIGRTEKATAVPGRWVQNGRTGGLVFMSDPVCR